MFRYIACFDLDRTILSVNSAGILIRHAYGQRLIGIMDHMAQWLKGIPEDRVKKLSLELVNDHLLQTIRSEIFPELKYHKDRDAGLVILSSSMFSICAPIAGHLGIDDIISSVFEVHHGLYTGRTTGHFCFGEEKLSRLKEFCTKNNHHMDDAWYYADSIWDYAVLNAVGHPVCINPDKNLRKAAIDKGWAVHDWR